MAYLKMRKAARLVDEITSGTFLEQKEELDRQDETKESKKKYIQGLLNEVIDHLFEIKTLDATKKDYHLDHKSSFREELMDCLSLLIKSRVSDMNDADKLISKVNQFE